MSQDVYQRLRASLDKMPVGFPETPTDVEIRILKKLFSPEQAELFLKLKNEPEPVSQISDRIGMNANDLAENLEEMAQKGLIFRVKRDGQALYQAFQFLVGIYEFQVNQMDEEFCQLFEEYLPYMMMSIPTLVSSQLRVIPIETALRQNTSIAPYNRAREIIKEEELVGVTECICRQSKALLGDECDKPKEVCLMFGDFARFYIDNNNARQITQKEVDDILKKAEEHGLVLNISNSIRPEFLCCCCSCCCPTIRGIKPMPVPRDLITTYYHAAIDAEQCSGCGECADICPLDAISEKNDIYMVDEQRCIGCGLCAGRCSFSAITMANREDKVKAPAETMAQALHELDFH